MCDTQLTVMAVDRGPGALPVFTKLTLRVTDVNNNSPQVLVNVLSGSGIAQVRNASSKPKLLGERSSFFFSIFSLSSFFFPFFCYGPFFCR